MHPPQEIPGAPQSAPAVVDTTRQSFSRFSREAEEISQLLVEGQWDQVWTRVYVGLFDFVIDQLLPALVVFGLLYAILRGVEMLLRRVLTRSKRVDYDLRNLLMRTFRVVGYIFLVSIVLDQLGVNVVTLLAGLSIVGIAVGFAARDSLENFISGVTILLDRPFRVGDNIEVQDTFGAVEEITLRSTRIRTLNNEVAVMPNSEMIREKLINHTMLNTLRVTVPFGIAYKEYPQEAREVVLSLTEGDERLHPDHSPSVVVRELDDSSVNMELRLFIRNPKLEVPVRLDYIEKVREALREADIEIPFPHLQLFVDEAKAFDDSFLMQPEPPRLGNGETEKRKEENERGKESA